MNTITLIMSMSAEQIEEISDIGRANELIESVMSGISDCERSAKGVAVRLQMLAQLERDLSQLAQYYEQRQSMEDSRNHYETQLPEHYQAMKRHGEKMDQVKQALDQAIEEDRWIERHSDMNLLNENAVSKVEKEFRESIKAFSDHLRRNVIHKRSNIDELRHDIEHYKTLRKNASFLTNIRRFFMETYLSREERSCLDTIRWKAKDKFNIEYDNFTHDQVADLERCLQETQERIPVILEGLPRIALGIQQKEAELREMQNDYDAHLTRKARIESLTKEYALLAKDTIGLYDATVLKFDDASLATLKKNQDDLERGIRSNFNEYNTFLEKFAAPDATHSNQNSPTIRLTRDRFHSTRQAAEKLLQDYLKRKQIEKSKLEGLQNQLQNKLDELRAIEAAVDPYVPKKSRSQSRSGSSSENRRVVDKQASKSKRRAGTSTGKKSQKRYDSCFEGPFQAVPFDVAQDTTYPRKLTPEEKKAITANERQLPPDKVYIAKLEPVNSAEIESEGISMSEETEMRTLPAETEVDNALGKLYRNSLKVFGFFRRNTTTDSTTCQPNANPSEEIQAEDIQMVEAVKDPTSQTASASLSPLTSGDDHDKKPKVRHSRPLPPIPK